MATRNDATNASTRNLRFSDVTDEPLEFLAPIGGHARLPIVTLEEAIDSLVSILPEVQSYAYIAKQRCKQPADGLTQDQSASIMLYTMSWEPVDECLYFVLNSTLRIRTPDRQQKLKPWHLYLRLFLSALFRLPLYRKPIYRGVRLEMVEGYRKDETVIWWGFSSCTTSVGALDSRLFLGKQGKRTIFNIHCETGRDIHRHSFFPDEHEVLLLAATQFQVNSVLDQGDLRIIQLEETHPPGPLLQPVPVDPLIPPGPPQPDLSSKCVSTAITSDLNLTTCNTPRKRRYLRCATIPEAVLEGDHRTGIQ